MWEQVLEFGNALSEISIFPSAWGKPGPHFSAAASQQGLLGGAFVVFNLTCPAVVKCLLLTKIFCCPVWFYTNTTEKSSDREQGTQSLSIIYALVYPLRQPMYPREQPESV